MPKKRIIHYVIIVLCGLFLWIFAHQQSPKLTGQVWEDTCAGYEATYNVTLPRCSFTTGSPGGACGENPNSGDGCCDDRVAPGYYAPHDGISCPACYGCMDAEGYFTGSQFYGTCQLMPGCTPPSSANNGNSSNNTSAASSPNNPSSPSNNPSSSPNNPSSAPNNPFSSPNNPSSARSSQSSDSSCNPGYDECALDCALVRQQCNIDCGANDTCLTDCLSDYSSCEEACGRRCPRSRTSAMNSQVTNSSTAMSQGSNVSTGGSSEGVTSSAKASSKPSSAAACTQNSDCGTPNSWTYNCGTMQQVASANEGNCGMVTFYFYPTCTNGRCNTPPGTTLQQIQNACRVTTQCASSIAPCSSPSVPLAASLLNPDEVTQCHRDCSRDANICNRRCASPFSQQIYEMCVGNCGITETKCHDACEPTSSRPTQSSARSSTRSSVSIAPCTSSQSSSVENCTTVKDCSISGEEVICGDCYSGGIFASQLIPTCAKGCKQIIPSCTNGKCAEVQYNFNQQCAANECTVSSTSNRSSAKSASSTTGFQCNDVSECPIPNTTCTSCNGSFASCSRTCTHTIVSCEDSTCMFTDGPSYTFPCDGKECTAASSQSSSPQHCEETADCTSPPAACTACVGQGDGSCAMLCSSFTALCFENICRLTKVTTIQPCSGNQCAATSSNSQTSNRSNSNSSNRSLHSQSTNNSLSSNRSNSFNASSQSSNKVGGVCDGTECANGGSDFCSALGQSCSHIDDLPCIVCLGGGSNGSQGSQGLNGSNNSETSRSSSRPTASSQASILVGGECDGTECFNGGMEFCAVQSRSCTHVATLPCIACVEENGMGGSTTGEGSSANSQMSISDFECSPPYKEYVSLVNCKTPSCDTDADCSRAFCLGPCNVLNGVCGQQCYPSQCIDNHCNVSQYAIDTMTQPPIVACTTPPFGYCPSAPPPCLAICGNNTPECNEECDDGNLLNDDGCSNTCFLEGGSCGDNVIQSRLGEQCEPNLEDAGVCDTRTCRYLAQAPSSSGNNYRCGDGRRTGSEECDDGNFNNNDSCDGNCRINNGRCGNGIVERNNNEECEPSIYTSIACSSTCRYLFDQPPVSLFPIIPPSSLPMSDVQSSAFPVVSSKPFYTYNPDTPDTKPATSCTTDAECSFPARCILNRCLTPKQVSQLPAFCGNARLDPGETCDNGSLNSDIPNASCRPDCTPSRCGDSITDTPLEQCDDGNTKSNDGCSEACYPERTAPPQTLPATTIELPFTESTTPTLSNPPTAPNTPNEPVLPSSVPSTPDTGPAAVLIMIGGAAAGYAFKRRK